MPLPDGRLGLGVTLPKSSGPVTAQAQVRAAGYLPKIVDLSLVRGALSEPVTIELEPLAARTPVHVRAVWADGEPFVGGLLVGVTSSANRKRRPVQIGVWFKNGKSVEPLPLPQGSCTLQATRGLGLGSFLCGIAMPPAIQVDVGADGQEEPQFELQGSRIRLDLRTSDRGVPIREFAYTFNPLTEGVPGRGTLSTGVLHVAVSIGYQGQMLYVPPGKHRLVVRALGFAPTHTIVTTSETPPEFVWRAKLLPASDREKK